MVATEDTETTEDGENCQMQIAKCKLQIRKSAIDNLQFAICNLQSLLCVLCVLCGSFVLTVRANAAQIVVPLEGEPFLGELISFGAQERVVFRAQGAIAAAQSAQRAFRLDDLVRWGHPRAPRPRILVVLADGGRLVAAAAWSGGAPVRMENGKIVVLTDLWGEVPLKRSLVRGLVFAQRNHPQEREELEEVVREEPSPGPEGSRNVVVDVVLLTNEDRATGRLAALSGGSLTLETSGGAVKLPLSRVEAVVFGVRRPSVASSPSKLAVGLRDGAFVYADTIRGNENQLIIAAGGLRLAGGSIGDVAFVQSLGGRFVYLSDLEPQGYRHVPYLSIEWPYARDRNVLDEPLSASGKRYLKGIGMHSAARLSYRLDGNYQRFDAAVAIDNSAGKRGSVTFGVYVQRESAWTEAFTSGIMRGGEAPRPVSVDLSGAEGLTLTVDFADRGDELDRANWLDARLVKIGN